MGRSKKSVVPPAEPREPGEPRRPAGMQAIDAKLWEHIQQAIRVLECSR